MKILKNNREIAGELVGLALRASRFRISKRGPARDGAGALPAQAGFTMVEIALSLGILAFALVAIIGVLPSGMKVQRENREGTVINQDAAYLLEAIRSGSRGVDDLTNYVESITVTNLALNGRLLGVTTYTNNIYRFQPFLPLTNAQHIVSLLSTPKYETLPNGNRRINLVSAHLRAISGNAADKSTNAPMSDFAFRYQVTCEVVPFAKDATVTNIPPAIAAAVGGDVLQKVNLNRNLYQVRLNLRWPLFQKGTRWAVGSYRRTASTLVSGELLPTYASNAQNIPNLYLFAPYNFISAY